MNYIKPVRNVVLGLFVAGAGLVTGGAVINEINKNKNPENVTIEMLQREINSTPEGRQMSQIVSALEHDIKMGQMEARKQAKRTLRDSQAEKEINSALNNSNNDLERNAIKAYALVRNTNNQVNDVLEDAIDKVAE